MALVQLEMAGIGSGPLNLTSWSWGGSGGPTVLQALACTREVDTTTPMIVSAVAQSTQIATSILTCFDDQGVAYAKYTFTGGRLTTYQVGSADAKGTETFTLECQSVEVTAGSNVGTIP